MAWSDDRMLTGLGAGIKQVSGRVLLAEPAAETPADLALDRAVRIGRPTSVMLLNLSRLQAPGPRPHHLRMCRVLLDEAMQAQGGQVFTCPNGDIALFASPEAAPGLTALVLGLFRAEASTAEQLLSTWTVPGDESEVRARLQNLRATAPAAENPPIPLGAIAAVGALLESARGGALVRRQTAVRVAGGGVSPLFQELSFSLAALEARVGVPIPAGADPYLFRHLATRLDERMLLALARGELMTGRTLHLNLTLPGVMSAGFEQLAKAAAETATQLGVELQFMEAVADLAAYAKAAGRLRHAGCRVVLDGLDYATLLIATPAALKPDALKLDWSPRIAGLAARDRRVLQRTIEAVGPKNVILHRAETEAALAWGLGQGIRSFQGRHVDAMLAADRLTACSHAAACTLRQCIDRAAATDEAGRIGCGNPALLDGVAGGAHQVATAP